MTHPVETPRYLVRVNGVRHGKYVEFDFAINEPDLAVELVLPVPQFEDFCQRYAVEFISSADGELIDAEKAMWRTGSVFRDASDEADGPKAH